MLQAILFDLDDTLTPDESAVAEALAAVGAQAHTRYGLDPVALVHHLRVHARALWRAAPTLAYCRTIGISSWEGLWARFLGADPALQALCAWAPTYRRAAWSRALAEQGIVAGAAADELAALFQHERRVRQHAYADVDAVLRLLRHDYQLAVVTNGAPDLQRDKLDRAGLTPYFAVVVISGDLGVGKPHPQMFLQALDRLAVGPAQAIMVGNSLTHDVAGAQAVEIRALWVNRTLGHTHDSAIGPDGEIRAFVHLPDALQQLKRDTIA